MTGGGQRKGYPRRHGVTRNESWWNHPCDRCAQTVNVLHVGFRVDSGKVKPNGRRTWRRRRCFWLRQRATRDDENREKGTSRVIQALLKDGNCLQFVEFTPGRLP